MVPSLHPHPEQPTTPRSAEAVVRYSQVFTLTMVIGLLLGSGALGFMGLTNAGTFTNPLPTPPAPAIPPVTPTGTSSASTLTDLFSILVPVFWVALLAFVLLIPGFLARNARKLWEARADDEYAMRRVHKGFASMSILQAAALEGPGLLGAIATMLTGNWLFLLAPLGSVLVLTALFPRTGRMSNWIEDATGTPQAGDAFGNAPDLADDEAA